MGKFFFLAVVFSVIAGFFNGKLPEVSAAAMEESSHAVQLSIKLLGSLCFWSGIMETARQSGFSDLIQKFLRPLLGLVFPKIKNEEKAMSAISMNVAANLLGMGNAATPLGISAMKELWKLSGNKFVATAEMVCFVVMNTASLQLLPTTVAAMRLESGNKRPFDILPAVWLVSACSLTVGIVLAKLLFPKGGKT